MVGRSSDFVAAVKVGRLGLRLDLVAVGSAGRSTRGDVGSCSMSSKG